MKLSNQPAKTLGCETAMEKWGEGKRGSPKWVIELRKDRSVGQINNPIDYFGLGETTWFHLNQLKIEQTHTDVQQLRN